MDNFKKSGFSYTEEKVDINPKLSVLMLRYLGMGHYDVLVENVNIKSEKRFLITNLGGENGYTQADNELAFKQIDDNYEYFTLKELFEKDSGKRWVEIVEVKEEGGIEVQTVREREIGDLTWE